MHLPKGIARKCLEPQDLSQQLDKLNAEMLSMTLAGTSAFGVFPRSRRNFKTFSSNSSEKTTYRMHFYGVTHCKSKKLVPVSRKQHLNFLSTCPWYIYFEYDADRLPEAMAKAECSCKKCLNSFSSSSSRKRGSCEKINSYVPVIRRTCPLNKNIYEYAVYMEVVPVGCTCMRKVRPLGKCANDTGLDTCTKF